MLMFQIEGKNHIGINFFAVSDTFFPDLISPKKRYTYLYVAGLIQKKGVCIASDTGVYFDEKSVRVTQFLKRTPSLYLFNGQHIITKALKLDFNHSNLYSIICRNYFHSKDLLSFLLLSMLKNHFTIYCVVLFFKVLHYSA